jgi:hypothetical protein
MDYTDDIRRLRAADPALADEIADFHTLEKVLPWLERRGIPFGAIEIEFQDEYSQDFMVPLGSDGRWLAFGIT